MNSEEKKRIVYLQSQGLGYKRIASTLGLPVNGVKSFCVATRRSHQQKALARCVA